MFNDNLILLNGNDEIAAREHHQNQQQQEGRKLILEVGFEGVRKNNIHGIF
jgi:hypothetical protein